MSTAAPSACRSLRELHRYTERRVQAFSSLLVMARRDTQELEDLLACAAELGVLFGAAATVQEELLYPALEPWAGGAGGSLERARREHAALRTNMSSFHRAVERMLFAPPADRAERPHVLQRGHALVALVEQHLGTEGDYLFRLADERLSEAEARELDAKFEAELARKLPGHMGLNPTGVPG